jgi:hypothetical protein
MRGAAVLMMATMLSAGAAPLPLRTLARTCAGGTTRIELTLGVLPRGVEIVVYTEDGKLIGTAAPFALRAGQRAGTYRFRLREELFRGDRVAFRLAAKQYGAAERAPTADEVTDMKVVCEP